MFDIISVQLSNFRSYVGPHEFVFPTVPGLYSITGYNKTNPRLGANDVGKTTLLEAIFWCFYGRTSRGLRAGEIISWGERTASVVVVCRVADCEYVIGRTQSPNSLVLNNTIVSQADLEKHLRLGPEQFCYSVMLPQFGSAFFDLGPSEKLNLFSQIMGLDYWLEKSKEADTLAKEMTNEIQLLDRTKVRYEGSLETLKNNIEACAAEAHQFANTQKAKIKQLKQGLKDAQAEMTRQKELLVQNQQELTQIDKRLSLAATICPTCRQPMNTERLKTLKQNQRDYQADMNRCERAFSMAQAKAESYEQQIAEEVDRENPYQEMAKTKALEIGSLERKIADTAAEIASLTADHAAVFFWVAGFKRVRLYVVETVLRQLEIEVNNNLVALGLPDWSITFDIERETKAGGVTKGFTVLIRPPNRADPVRWEAFGGGATQRLRLAGNLGIANLIMERAGLHNQIEFYDEPSHHMADSGIADLLVCLQERASETERKIWIVDHHSLEYGDFAGVLKVVKTEKGSQLQWKKG